MSNTRRLRPVPPVSTPRRDAGTRWNGEPVYAARVRVKVADDSQFPQYWARSFVGTIRAAVRVTCNGDTFYLDDEDGSGWYKVTHGGGPGLPHRDLVISREVSHGTP